MNLYNREFVIVTPKNNKGGTIVLHKLCEELTLLGYNARIFYNHKFPDTGDSRFISFVKLLQGDIHYLKKLIKYYIQKILCKDITCDIGDNLKQFKKTCKRKWFPFVSKNTIVVYPEVCPGNFLGAKNVVRWMLYFSPNTFNTNSYDVNDLFISYTEGYNDYRLNPDCKTVGLKHFNFDLYKQYNYGKRKGCCYVIRKGKNRKDLPTKYKGIIIDRLPEKEKVKVLNECEICYFYDGYTAYIDIAIVCGCVPVVLYEDYETQAINEEYFSHCIAVNDSADEIERVKKTRDKYIGLLNQQINNNSNEINKFIKYCEEKFE